MKRRVERGRRSAKQTVSDFADELLKRRPCEETNAKIMALQTIALRMSWNDLYNRLRFRTQPPLLEDEPRERPERWWDR